MPLRNFNTRAVSQNTPASSCQELLGVCISDAVVLIFLVIFVGGLLLVTVVRNLWARRRGEDHAEPDTSPPPYPSIGFPLSASRDLALSKESPGPLLDPYHIVPPSFDNSLLLKDEYFSHVLYPDPTLAPIQQQHQRTSSDGLGFGLGVDNSAPSGPPAAPSNPSLTSPPPAYVREPRRDAAVDRTL
ncbi:hypothetical protein K438DRAFT_1955184 [Mycena galopus ATCC 62051]|nr:hypothetical protein K438DRAFT_1955184 [Mycena galopus ATCC 62051]